MSLLVMCGKLLRDCCGKFLKGMYIENMSEKLNLL